MDPVTLIVTALATGAAAGLTANAEQAVKDAYKGLKNLIQSRFSQVDVKPLEQKPESKAKQDSIAEDLADSGADQDAEVLRTAQELIKLIESRAPEAAAAIGIDLEQLRAGGSINIEDVVASGTGIRGKDWEAQQDINLKGIHAGQTSPAPQPSRRQGDDPNS
jgi:hypothetical protein